VSGVVNRPPRPGLESTGRDCIRALRKRRAQRRIRDLRDELEKAKVSGDEKRTDDLNAQYLSLQREVLAL